MKKWLLILAVFGVILLVITGSAFAKGSAVNMGPAEAFKKLEDRIQTLPVYAFVKEKAAAGQKKALSRQIEQLTRTIENGAYKSAMNSLDGEIRKNIQQWIVSAEQTGLMESVDNAIAAVNNASQSTITIADGKIAGADAGFNCWTWKGIPYAKPPVGELRWKAPQDPKIWQKIRQYDDIYNPCTQPVMSEWAFLNQIKGSEDCLYLDVYSPKTRSGKLPVYFWIHGGANTMGSASQFPKCGLLAANSNVVVVVIQYRLGPFGFFTHPALNPKGTEAEKSGNFAVLDQIKALQWVQRNISYFGGDPSNVMIGGESAGGLNTLNLMISPFAKGLFHKALVQSAGGKNIPVTDGTSQANAVIDKLLVGDGTVGNLTQAANFRAAMSYDQIETFLRKKKGNQILQAMMGANGYIETSINPFIDKHVIPGTVAEAFKSGDYNHVPVILGSNQCELKPFLPGFLGMVPTSSGYTWSNITNIIGGVQPPLTLEQVMPPDSKDRALYEEVAKYPSLHWKAAMVDSLARLLKSHQDNVYCYWFQWGGPGSGSPPADFLMGPGHGFDIPFFFGTDDGFWGIKFTKAGEEGRKSLSKAMMSFIASFIASGNPNQTSGGLPVWEEWSNNPGAPKSIIFNADFTRPKIGMMNKEYTKEEIMSQINALSSQWERDLIMTLLWN